MKAKNTSILLLITAPLVAGCSLFSPSLDYDKLQTQITNKLNSEYEKVGVKVESLSCDESAEPKAGDKFTCEAKVRDVTVPIDVTVNDDGNANFVTTKRLYVLEKVGPQIAPGVSQTLKEQVSVDCGTGLKVVEPGGSFDCGIANATGDKATIAFKAGPVDGEDSWEVKRG